MLGDEKVEDLSGDLGMYNYYVSNIHPFAADGEIEKSAFSSLRVEYVSWSFHKL